jgi:hypothetical protein
MKSLLLAILSLAFVGCSSDGSSVAGFGPQDVQTLGNKSLLTETAWCEGHETYSPFETKAYVFRPDFTVRFLTWTPSNNRVHFEKVMNWALDKDILQIADEVGNEKGRLVKFENLSGKSSMVWRRVGKKGDPLTISLVYETLYQCQVPAN